MWEHGCKQAHNPEVLTNQLLDHEAAAARLGTTAQHIRWLVQRRVLPVVKVGGLNRFDPADLERFIEEHRRPAAAS